MATQLAACNQIFGKTKLYIAHAAGIYVVKIKVIVKSKHQRITWAAVDKKLFLELLVLARNDMYPSIVAKQFNGGSKLLKQELK